MIFIPEKFRIEELLPEKFFNQYMHYGERLWLVIDYRISYTLHRLRTRYGSTTINNWIFGGHYQHSGFREFQDQEALNKPNRMTLSQHLFGRAMDAKFKNYTAEEVRQDILKEPFHEDFKYITCLEKNVSWLHFDTRNHDKDKRGILIV